MIDYRSTAPAKWQYILQTLDAYFCVYVLQMAPDAYRTKEFVSTAVVEYRFLKPEDPNKGSYFPTGLALDVDTAAELSAAAKLATKVARAAYPDDKSPEGIRPDVEDLHRALDSLKAVQVVYDKRVDSLAHIKDIPDASLHRYMDDYKALGFERCRFHSLAETSKAAAADMIRQAAEDNHSWSGVSSDQWLERFVQNGRPTTILAADPPVVITWPE